MKTNKYIESLIKIVELNHNVKDRKKVCSYAFTTKYCHDIPCRSCIYNSMVKIPANYIYAKHETLRNIAHENNTPTPTVLPHPRIE